MRKVAEKRLVQRGPTRAGAPDGVIQRLVHELEVHQIELEMQNEELLNAQIEIAESRQRYSDLFDFAPVSYVTFTDKAIIKEINLTGSLMLGSERAFLTGKPFLSYLKRDDIKRFMDYMRNALITREKSVVELGLAVKGGSLPVELTSMAVVDAAGCINLRVVITDISRRKEAEAELKKYRLGLEALVETRTAELKAEVGRHVRTGRMLAERDENLEKVMGDFTDGIIILTDDGALCPNARLARMLGYTIDELCEMRLKDILADDSSGVIESCVRELTHARMASYRAETWLVSNDGERIAVELVASSMVYHGRGAALVVVCDLTEHKRLEEEQVKTQKLESLGILAGGIAHDFNNMLTGILGNLSMASRLVGPEHKARTWLTEAAKACHRATDLTKQLLTFSRGGAPVLETFSARELLRSSASFSLSGSKSRCEFFLPDAPLNVMGDKGQINQVINNLVINAAQAMADGGVIKVGADELVVGLDSALPLDKGRYVRFFVEDCGHGIAAEDLPKIFDPYFTTKPTGSGLGLASAYSIIKRHGGHISVTSAPGGPTRFDVYLEASGEAVKKESRKVYETIASGSGSILVMDDDEMIRVMVALVLKSDGYEVECASDGAEAIELYQQAAASGRPFDLVIMDATIPGGMGGGTCIKILREQFPDVRAVVSSGYSNDSIMANYEKHGFCGAIPKPYDLDVITGVINSAMTKPR